MDNSEIYDYDEVDLGIDKKLLKGFIKQYIKENLSIEIKVYTEGYSDYINIKAEVSLDGEYVTESVDNISASTIGCLMNRNSWDD